MSRLAKTELTNCPAQRIINEYREIARERIAHTIVFHVPSNEWIAERILAALTSEFQSCDPLNSFRDFGRPPKGLTDAAERLADLLPADTRIGLIQRIDYLLRTQTWNNAMALLGQLMHQADTHDKVFFASCLARGGTAPAWQSGGSFTNISRRNGQLVFEVCQSEKSPLKVTHTEHEGSCWLKQGGHKNGK